MAEKTEDALGGIAAPKAEEAKSAAKTYETPLKEAYEAGDLPARLLQKIRNCFCSPLKIC